MTYPYEVLSNLSDIPADRLRELREGEDSQMTLDETERLAKTLLMLPKKQLEALAFGYREMPPSPPSSR